MVNSTDLRIEGKTSISLGRLPLWRQIMHDTYYGYNRDVEQICMLDWTFTQLRRDSASNGKIPFKEEYKILKCELRFGAFFNLHILNGKIKYGPFFKHTINLSLSPWHCWKIIQWITLLLDTYKYNKDVCHYINILLFHNFVILIHFGHRFSSFHL